MLEDLVDMNDTTEPSKIGPDYFSFYTQETQKLLSLDEDFFHHFSLSKASEPAEQTSGDEKDIIEHIFCKGKESNTATRSFSQGLGGKLSEFKKERLKSLLKQTVVSLSQEVDDMLDPVIAIRQIKSQLKSSKSLTNHSAAARDVNLGEQPRKKIRLSSLSSSESDDDGNDADILQSEIVNGAKRCCDICHSTETTMQTDLKESKSLCKFCTLKFKQENVSLSEDDQTTGSCRASNIEANTESKEVDNDLQFLMENDTERVESSIKKYYDELLMMLEHMEQQLEGLLDLLQSSNS